MEPKAKTTNDSNGNNTRHQLLSTMKDIDLTVFENPGSECSRPPNEEGDDISITELCAATTRLCAAMRYHDAIHNSKVLDDDAKSTLFVEFNEVVYGSVLEDTTHFVNVHSNDIQQVHAEWTQRYGVPKCSISECIKLTRHYERGRRDNQRKMEKKHDAVYSFYQSLYDRVHHFIFHLYDIGLRVETPSFTTNNHDGDDEEKKADSVGVTVDKLFAAERDQIKSRRKELDMNIERMDSENSKFTIQIVSAMTGAVTLTDALFRKLMENKEIQRETLHRLSCFVEDQGFDSDSITMDIEDLNDSNVYIQIQSQVAIEVMMEFIRTTELRRRAFSTGFIFNYWDENDKMYVKPRHKNLKEEILESGYLSMDDWKEFVEFKATKYMKLKKLKKLRSGRAYWGKRTSIYGKRSNERKRVRPVTLEHLYAIISYCDLGLLCTAFSATFRLRDAFEDLQSLLLRHSHFAIFARFLVELVLDFGTNGHQYTTKYQRGPFFCGLQCELNIGSFAIYLKGPCSTTVSRPVAINFAKSNGIILMLDNDGSGPQLQRFFDCSWISNYIEEAERLWIAGTECLRIVSILIVRNPRSYIEMLRILYLFDAMISGVNVDGLKIKERPSDKDVIEKLIELELCGGVSDFSEFDLYLKHEWKLFLQNKENIYLKLDLLSKHFKIMSKVVISNVVNNWGTKKKPSKMDNVLYSNWLHIFPLLRTVRIGSFAKYGESYRFHLKMLLAVMESLPHSIVWIVEDGGWWMKGPMKRLRIKFTEKGWNIEYKRRNGWEFKHKETLNV